MTRSGRFATVNTIAHGHVRSRDPADAIKELIAKQAGLDGPIEKPSCTYELHTGLSAAVRTGGYEGLVVHQGKLTVYGIDRFGDECSYRLYPNQALLIPAWINRSVAAHRAKYTIVRYGSANEAQTFRIQPFSFSREFGVNR